ncbi:MAG: hypothetical protein K6G15_03345 [Desulfovibrio sp.]|nr:hypothetical protein [Desulfovibrio sp.]
MESRFTAVTTDTDEQRGGWEEALISDPQMDDSADFSAFDAVTTAFDDAEWTWPQSQSDNCYCV